MTNTTHTVDGTATLPGAPRTSITRGLRHHKVALLIAIAVVALAAWTVVQLQGAIVVADPQPSSILQADHAELQQQGVTNYDELPAVQRSQEQYGTGAGTAASQTDLQSMERDELLRFRNGAFAAKKPYTGATIRQLEPRTGSSPNE